MFNSNSIIASEIKGMIGFKNLVKINHSSQDQLVSFERTVEQAIKIATAPLNYFQSMVNLNQTSKTFFEKWLIDYQTCDVEEIRKSLFWTSLAEVSKRLSSIKKQFHGELKGYFMEASKKADSRSTSEFQIYSQLKNKLRSYKAKEQFILQCYKNFGKLHKSILISIDTYKKSFTDVKLIYNKKEKLKRYLVCESQYDQLMSYYGKIMDNLSPLTELRNQLLQCFKKYISAIGEDIKNVGDCALMLQNQFVQLTYQKQLSTINVFTNALSKLEKCQYQLEFSYSLTDIQAEKYIQDTASTKKHSFIPFILLNYEHIKDSNIMNIGPLLSKYEMELIELIRKRKIFMKRSMQNFQFMVKCFEKILNMNSHFGEGFQKRKKKFLGYYGIPHYFTTTLSCLINENVVRQTKLFKKICSGFKKVEQLVSQESKCLELMHKKFKAYCLQKFFNKRDSKAGNNEKKNKDKKVQLKMDESQLSKIQLHEKMNHLQVFFESYHQKTKNICISIKKQISEILSMLEKSAIQTYTLIKTEKETNGYNPLQNKVINNIDEVSLAKLKIFKQSILSGLLEQESKSITFEWDLNKVQDFKKLKKPIQLQDNQMQQIIQSLQQNSKEPSKKQRLSYSTQNEERTKGDEKSKNKYEALLICKKVMQPNQRYVEGYSCALAHNILLSGRLLITTERLCFYSKFNTSNIFFGETFIQIPKKDIKKIEKQQSAIVFNNSISITTIHGQFFFTSFFSRNQAYEKILLALDKKIDQTMYEPEQIQQVAIQQEPVVEEEDDIKDQALEERAKAIDSKLKSFQYREILNSTLKFKDMTALKYFKLFQLNNQISYNRGKHLGFPGYFRSVIGHTEVVFEQWQPKIFDYLNSSNIKNGTPLSFYRVVKQIVPLSNTGIPFMPKTSKIQQRMNLYFYSKDKIVFEIEYKSFGVPYCDYFVLNFRKEITTLKDQNAVQFKMLFCTTFVTNTIMKSVIQNRSFDESKASMVKLEEEMKKYLSYLEKITAKNNALPNKDETENQQLKNENFILQQVQSQIQQLKGQKNELDKDLNTKLKSHSLTKKILIASLLLNLALLLILMI